MKTKGIDPGELKGNPVSWEIIAVLWSEKLETAFALTARDKEGNTYSIEPVTPGPLNITKMEKPGDNDVRPT